MLMGRFEQSRMLQDTQADLREEAAKLSPGAERGGILQDLRHDRANSPGLQPLTMNFVERCFVALTVAGFIGLVTVIWMWPT